MHIKPILMGTILAVTLAGCSNWTDMERAGAGAAGGALLAGATRGNLLTGALIGAAAGALCDDAGLYACN